MDGSELTEGVSSMGFWTGISTGFGFFLLLSSCATGGVGGAQACRSDLTPHDRSLNELADSAALQERLESIWEPVNGLVLGWIRFDSTGAKDTVGIRTESLSETQRNEVRRALSFVVLSSPGRKDGTNIFLGDEDGPAVRRLARVQACKPEILNRETLSRAIEEEGRRLDIRDRREVILNALVLPDGAVGEVQVHRSSGDPQIDFLAVRAFRSAEFSPALIEGIRVQVWTQFPVVFRPRSRGDRQTR